MRLSKHKYNDDIAMDVIRLLTNNNRLVGQVKLMENGSTFVWIGDKLTKNAAEVNINNVRKRTGFLWDKWYVVKIASMIVYVIARRTVGADSKRSIK